MRPLPSLWYRINDWCWRQRFTLLEILAFCLGMLFLGYTVGSILSTGLWS